jgi:hypothetical protein
VPELLLQCDPLVRHRFPASEGDGNLVAGGYLTSTLSQRQARVLAGLRADGISVLLPGRFTGG